MLTKATIAILIPSLECGGAERSASLLANHLAEQAKYNVIIYTLSNEEPFYYLYPGIQIINIDTKTKNKNFFVKNFNRIKTIKFLNETNNVDLIIGYTSLSAVLACAAAVGKSIKCIICERSNPVNTDRVQKIARSLVYSRNDGSVFQTDYAKKYFKQKTKNGIIIPNFIKADELPSFIPIKERKKKITTVGRLVESKNHKMLISAFDLIKEDFPLYRLEIFGEGKLYNELTEYIRKLNLQKQVFLMGETAEVFNNIKDSSLFVFTSKYEGFPNALLEAVSLGLPCIATDSPAYAPRQIFKDYEFGELVALNDLEDLSYKMRNAISSEIDEDRLIEKTNNIRRKYDINTQMQKWVNYIDDILDGVSS